MSITPDQVRELDKYQNKFLKGEITTQEYEIAKEDILSWDIPKDTTKPFKKIRIEDEEPEKDFVYYLIIFLWGVLMFLKDILRSIWKGLVFIAKAIHKSIVSLAKKKHLSIKKLYTIIWVSTLILVGAVVWISQLLDTISENQRIESNRKLAEVQAKKAEVANEQKLAEEKRIANEKAKTPQPNITLLSSTGSQGKNTTYHLSFKADNITSVLVNSLAVTGSGNIYSKDIKLEDLTTDISIFAKNAFYTTRTDISISRDKNADDRAKEEQMKKDAEEKARQEQQKAEEKKQTDEKARIQALNNTFKKNCIDPTWTLWQLDYYLKKSVLKDPDSYQRINTYYEDDWDVFNVFIKYRAKNSYGWYVVEFAWAKVWQDCAIIDYLGSVNPDTLDL